MSISYIYKLVEINTGQFYIGYRTIKGNDPYEDLGKMYFSSSKIIRKIGFNNFYFGIIETHDDHDTCYWREQYLIKENFKNPLILNRSYFEPNGKKVFSFYGVKMSDEQKRKISNSKIGKKINKSGPPSLETRLKISESKRGKPHVYRDPDKMKARMQDVAYKTGFNKICSKLIWINNGLHSKRIYPELLHEYPGYSKGRI